MEFLVVLLMWSAVNGQATYTTSKHHCFYCPPGTYVMEHCQEDLTNSTCAPCPQFHYNDQPSRMNYCRRCKSSCPKWSGTITNCSKVTNRKCECDYGYHKHPLDAIDDQWKCEPHTKCSKDEGEVYHGNHTHDTKCEKCRADQFVNQTDPKRPRCQACTADSHSVCGPQGNATRQVVPADDTTTAPLSTSHAAAEEQHLSGGAIAGIVCAVILCVIIAVVVLILKCRRSPECCRNPRGGRGLGPTDRDVTQPMNDQRSQSAALKLSGDDGLGNEERATLDENNTGNL